MEPGTIEIANSERPAAMRTRIVQRVKFSVEIHQRQSPAVNLNRASLAGPERVRFGGDVNCCHNFPSSRMVARRRDDCNHDGLSPFVAAQG